MPSSPARATPRPMLRSVLGPFADRPRLMSGIATGLLAFLLLSIFAGQLQWTLRAVMSWDLLCLLFNVLIIREMRVEQSEDIRVKVAQQDEGHGVILIVVLMATAFSLVAVGLELSLAKDDHGLFKSVRVAIAGLTVVLSWFMVQLIFALHYAHEYYAPDRATADETDVVGGLAFPGKEPPDYWDFLHFAVVIGVACQTADIAFSSKRLRRIGTVQGLVAFFFNTAVLALSINLLAGLF